MSSRPTIALVACADYDWEHVQQAVRACVDHLGGMGAFVQPGQRVLLKPNLVRAMSPDKAVTTHPTVVAAVAQLVIEAGGEAIIVESPGGPYTTGTMRNTYRKTEMEWAAEISGAKLNEDLSTTQVSHPEGIVLHRLDIVQPLLDVDLVINLPKLKTHNLTMLTLGVKNLFGLVPGALKIGYHAKLQDPNQFAQGLLDIASFAKPSLTLMDAIVAMEGEGPSGGDPRQVGAILASADVHALDVAAATLVGFDPLDVLTIQAAVGRGLTSGNIDDVDLVGDALADLQVTGFRPGTASAFDPGLLPPWLRALLRLGGNGQNGNNPEQEGHYALVYGWFSRQLVAVPVAGGKCIGCGYCVRHCPVEAITLVNGIAQMDHKKCIRCYCCHELCPELAVELKKPWLGRMLTGE